ncbi:MAG: Pls/PosA family non-ribosomal peptide synthetase, partial [Solirubrobacteraceae bacterium]
MIDLTLDGSSLPEAAAMPTLGPAGQATLVDIFDATVRRWGERPAIDAAGVRLSYTELADAAQSVADELAASGVGPGDRVGVRIPSGTADLYVAILGVMRAGAAYVPVDADDPPGRAEQIFSDAGVCVVLGPKLSIQERAPGGGRLTPPGPDDDAWVIFTSGSTGAPKGVAVTHRAAVAFVHAESALWQVIPQDRVLAGLSVAFDASCEEMWLAWGHGAALVPAPRRLVRAGRELGPWLSAERVTVISTVPTLAATWDEEALDAVRLLILGGEACPEQLGWRLAERREVWNTYGPTEATVVSTAARVASGAPITIGAPLTGWDVAVIDDSGMPVAAGEPGELVIAGAGLGRYLDCELDRERFAGLPSRRWQRAYRTGDIVRETAGGLVYVGRRDDQVKIGGRRVELGEIDAQLGAIAGVRSACTLLRETASGNRVLVGYVAGDATADQIRCALADRLPAELVPLIVALEDLPVTTSGKVDRNALPWPPPDEDSATDAGLSDTERWLAERWRDQLGAVGVSAHSDFFALGGTSLAAARLASELRERFPAFAVADIYNHRGLQALGARLDELGAGSAGARRAVQAGSSRWGLVRVGGVLALTVLTVPQWLIGLLVLNRIMPGQGGPQVGWAWLIAGWLVFSSSPGRALVVAGARRLLLRGLAPGRYPRNGWLMCRLWFMDRLADRGRLDNLAGTPWAARYARWAGHSVGAGARLGTLPPVGSLVRIGHSATIEGDVDLAGWWIEGDELVVGTITIEEDARIATRTLLMPGTVIGAGAEIEPGSVVQGPIPPGERWSGSPAVPVGRAGEHWPAEAAPRAAHARLWKAMYAVGLLGVNLIALLAAIPGLALLLVLVPGSWSAGSAALMMAALAPALTASFMVSEAVLVALVARLSSRLVTTGWHIGDGRVGWALWFTDTIMAAGRAVLFPVYASVYIRPWLRLAGVTVGRGSEISTAVGLTRLTRFAPGSFAADDVVLAVGRARAGWLNIEPITIGRRTFMGNGAILRGGTTLGDDSLIGLLTLAPTTCGDQTSWLGSPALELPRRRRCDDPALTTDPSRRRVAARAAVELVRILLPGTISVLLAVLMFDRVDAIGTRSGLWAMAAATPLALLGAGVCAVAITIAVKWILMGRYRAGDHPLWSWFVWRDEIVNTCQETLAGPWLLGDAVGTPLMPVYLRLMGARVGRDVWCETLTITEFDLVELGDGAVINRHAVVETHLFHDRVMQLGPVKLGAGATLGPGTATLPDTELGEGCSVGGRSIVMRGERLPAHT